MALFLVVCQEISIHIHAGKMSTNTILYIFDISGIKISKCRYVSSINMKWKIPDPKNKAAEAV